MTHTPDKKADYFRRRRDGETRTQAARALGIDQSTAWRWEKLKEEGALHWLEKKAENALPNPKKPEDLSPEALRALDDFEFWRWRYMGRRSRPWQVEAAKNVVEWLASDQTELMVVNCPPGAGKSTLFTCDIPLWMICRDRTIRIFLGHRVKDEAEKYARRIRKALERTRPLPADPSQGRMESAAGCLAQDYGRFKPTTGDVWRADEFTVLAEFDYEESVIEDKEATVTAKGMGTEFLGMRSELVIWDDLVTQRVLASADQLEQQRVWWDNEAVTRVEPGGCLMLVGQRMGAEDLYRYCLDERLPPDEEFDDDFVDSMTSEQYDEWLERVGESRYRHIIYPAHFEHLCTGKHGKGEEFAYPNGCLLDPIRLPWKGRNSLMTIRANRESKFRVQYQQEDVDPDEVLVPRLWIDGGSDKDGNIYPGCLDKYRGLCDVPKGLSHPVLSIATADPSPTNYWGIEWWLYHPASEARYLIDLHRGRMGANEWLDWNENTKEFYGIAHDWQLRSKQLGFPITHWIFEKNAAQQFVLQFDHVHRWIRKMGVRIIGHTTSIRKQDEEYGIQMLRDRYRYGNVRLPYLVPDKSYFSSPAKTASDYLIREATTYPQAITTDCLMAQYFLEYNLPQIAATVNRKPKRAAPRPSWMKQKAAA